jgi:hypothetical protein
VMVTKSKNENVTENDEKRQRVKIGQLILNKETVKDLTTNDARLIRGGGKCISDQKGIGPNNAKPVMT